MKTVVLFIMIQVCFNFCLKQTFISFRQQCITSLVCALFVGFIWPVAIEQSSQQIESWLADQSLMLDTSVLLSLETLWQMAFCLVSAKLLYEDKPSRIVGFCAGVLRLLPGVLILLVLFASEVALIYALPGVGFSTVAWILAAAVLVAIPMISWLVRLLLPENDLRLEILFLCNAVLLLLGIVATVNGSTSFKGTDEIDWTALMAFLLLAFVCGSIGWLRYRKNIKS